MSARIDTSTGLVASLVDCLRDEGCPSTAAILEALAAERDAALAREEKLRDALAPFVGAAKARAVDAPEWRDGDTVSIVVTVGDLRAALQAAAK